MFMLRDSIVMLTQEKNNADDMPSHKLHMHCAVWRSGHPYHDMFLNRVHLQRRRGVARGVRFCSLMCKVCACVCESVWLSIP